MAGFSATRRGRIALIAPVLFASAMTAGCMSSPTYGTDKTANEQLYDDVTGMFSLGGNRREQIDYKPRPDLVRPSSTARLPPPQESVATAGTGNWPESPEQRRMRIRAEATANQGNPNYRSEVVADMAPQVRPSSGPRFGREIPENGTEPGAMVKRAEFNRRLTEQRQGSPTTRKYLSEPPLAYRQPAPTAATDDIGEDEAVKERRAKAAAKKASGNQSNSWRDYLPF